ncbi:hypothetical protein JZU71_05125, partial [bacterium]|nr:hypothetical protein [bacterium]
PAHLQAVGSSEAKSLFCGVISKIYGGAWPSIGHHSVNPPSPIYWEKLWKILNTTAPDYLSCFVVLRLINYLIEFM